MLVLITSAIASTLLALPEGIEASPRSASSVDVRWRGSTVYVEPPAADRMEPFTLEVGARWDWVQELYDRLPHKPDREFRLEIPLDQPAYVLDIFRGVLGPQLKLAVTGGDVAVRYEPATSTIAMVTAPRTIEISRNSLHWTYHSDRQSSLTLAGDLSLPLGQLETVRSLAARITPSRGLVHVHVPRETTVGEAVTLSVLANRAPIASVGAHSESSFKVDFNVEIAKPAPVPDLAAFARETSRLAALAVDQPELLSEITTGVTVLRASSDGARSMANRIWSNKKYGVLECALPMLERDAPTYVEVLVQQGSLLVESSSIEGSDSLRLCLEAMRLGQDRSVDVRIQLRRVP